MTTVLVGLLAQLVHIALVGAAAPTLSGIQGWLETRLAGRVGTPVLQPWRDLRRLMRKQSVAAESASGVTELAPLVAATTTAVAACLVPSFTLGMSFAPVADLLAIAGLLTIARCALALAGMDAGSARGGVAASRSMLLACLSEPALLLVLLALGLLAGSLNIDLLAAQQSETLLDWRPAVGFALAATLLVGLVDTLRYDAVAEDVSGPTLALVEGTGALRLLVWFNLIGAMFLPFGMAGADAGPIAWAVGIIAWLIRTLLAATLLALLHSGLGHIGLVRAAQVLGVAVLFGLLATLFLLADMGAA